MSKQNNSSETFNLKSTEIISFFLPALVLSCVRSNSRAKFYLYKLQRRTTTELARSSEWDWGKCKFTIFNSIQLPFPFCSALLSRLCNICGVKIDWGQVAFLFLFLFLPLASSAKDIINLTSLLPARRAVKGEFNSAPEPRLILRFIIGNHRKFVMLSMRLLLQLTHFVSFPSTSHEHTENFQREWKFSRKIPSIFTCVRRESENRIRKCLGVGSDWCGWAERVKLRGGRKENEKLHNGVMMLDVRWRRETAWA